MATPQKPIKSAGLPVSLQLGIAMFAICGVLAKAYSQENGITKMPSILSLLFLSSILLMGIGGVKFIVKNESLRLNSKDDRIRSFYIYLVFSLVGVFIAFAAVFAIINMK